LSSLIAHTSVIRLLGTVSLITVQLRLLAPALSSRALCLNFTSYSWSSVMHQCKRSSLVCSVFFHDVHLVPMNEYFRSIDNVVKETICFNCCEWFLFTYSVIDLSIIAFLQEICSLSFMFCTRIAPVAYFWNASG
jgi:hypothetical protein